ncbi:beta-propeller domain-containing protein [Gudongella sp. SC589]|uniref:beta-propeller domain-containing protein n=1 Tax=Gudongella sp. SC589 TaxID=3385990 RepID=UPI003904A0C4
MKKIVSILLIIAMTMGGVFSYGVEAEGDIALHLGSPLILSGKDMIPLDSENPGVVPVIHNDRTLVPLRAISEHFGAEVDYDAVKREASILLNGAEYLFPIGKNYYDVVQNEESVERIEFDTEALIIQDRTMVPLRIIAENILGMEVAYDKRVIFIGKGQEDIDDEMVLGVKNKIGQALKVSSRGELLALIEDMEEIPMEEAVREPVLDSQAPAMGDSSAGQDGAKDFSNTNEQVEGINEADIVKTDGTYIYVATRDSIKIYRANDGRPVLTDQMEVVLDKETGEYVEYSQLYVDDGKLVVLGRKGAMGNWIRPMPEPMPMEKEMMDSIMPYGGEEYVYLGVYDINGEGKMNLVKELEVEGGLLSSRKKDDHVYLVVNKYLNYYWAYPERPIPLFKDSTLGSEYKELPVDSILYHPGRRMPNYLLIAAVDIMDGKEPASIEAYLGSGSEVYMSENALYVSGNDYNSFWGSVTNIARFTVDDTTIGYSGGGMVQGSLLNQFSMDEFDGNLRVATTEWSGESLNSVYILDRNMNLIGSIENLAPGERIFSARFMGDMGYIVTFRQIDPLFVLDLSDPENPQVTGELKVPGFSNYLHPISKDVLLGIGQDVDENTGVQQGIKLSLFDVSDSGKPKEIKNLILGETGSYAEVLHNHKALMLKPQDDLIAFDATLNIYSGKLTREAFNGLVVIKASETGDLELIKEISNEGIYGQNVKRPLYIDDILYYVMDDNIRAFNMDGFEEIK